MVKWFQTSLQEKVNYKSGDIIVSVPAKSGTTWTMNIIHQIRSGGDDSFKDIYAEVPWVEFKEHPDQSDEELIERWDQMKDLRAFKTHSFPNSKPGGFINFRKDLKYIVVFRNPEEALVSFKPFLESHSPELFQLWNVDDVRKEICNFDNFTEFFEKCILKGFPGMPADQIPPGGLVNMFFTSFINSWWPLRNEPNVLMMHFNDMKENHDEVLRKVSEFLNIQPSESEWEQISKYTSFSWMKKNEEKFEMSTLLPFPVIQRGGMIRKGEKGKAYEDGMTTEISSKIKYIIDEFVEDDYAKHWIYTGGNLNDVETLSANLSDVQQNSSENDIEETNYIQETYVSRIYRMLREFISVKS
tara:strand:- start:480 stop:1550 length:1071 start_codon:yes stop_codon:yes gene_type:complete